MALEPAMNGLIQDDAAMQPKLQRRRWSCPFRGRRLSLPVSSSRKKLSVAVVYMAFSVTVTAVLALTQGFRFIIILHQLEIISQFIKSPSFLVLSDHTNSDESMPDILTSSSPMSALSYTPDTDSLDDQPPPSLSSLIDQHNNITGDVQFLLDFAVIAYAKCGTTTFVQWMSDHSETLILPNENYAFRSGRPVEFVRRMYRLQPQDVSSHRDNDTFRFVTRHNNITFRRGYKNPSDIQQTSSIRYIRTHFPKTKLIVGIRQPILWFQSFFNYRVQSLPTPKNDTDKPLMPHPNRMIGRCRRSMHQVCTDSSLFHVHLAKLGKTQLTEDELDDPSLRRHRDMIVKNGTRPDRMPNPIFLYEITQLRQPHRGSHTQQQRSLQFRHDVKAFLGLRHELPPIPNSLPDPVWDDPQVQAYRNSQKIRICDDQYAPVRRRLLEQSQEVSSWIRKYFLDAPGVYVSSRDYLEELLEKWMYDPCNQAITANATTIKLDP